MSNKYNRKLKYMQHHQLGGDISLVYGVSLIAIIITFIITFFDVKYTPYLKAFDVAIYSTFLVYFYMLRRNIYKGKIKAYYRRDYNDISIITGVYLIALGSAKGRLLVVFLKYFFKNEGKIIIDEILENAYIPFITWPTVLISIYVFYLVFFSDKYVTIKEYSNEVNYRRKELEMNEKDAINDFLRCKDEQYNIREYDGVYYDYKETNKKSINVNDEKKDNEIVRRSYRG